MNLSQRQRQPEWMDQPDLDPQLHAAALRGLERIHRCAGTVRRLFGPIAEFASRQPAQPMKVLDIACGGGAVSVGLAKLAEKHQIRLQIDGCDLSDEALAFAKQRSQKAGVSVNFFRADVLSVALPTGYDCMVSSLFFHHLDDQDVVALLSSMQLAEPKLIVVSDLLRSRVGYALAWTACRVLTTSRVCRFDGPVSVQGSFSLDEILALAHRSGLNSASIRKYWPEQWLLTWGAES